MFSAWNKVIKSDPKDGLSVVGKFDSCKIPGDIIFEDFKFSCLLICSCFLPITVSDSPDGQR